MSEFGEWGEPHNGDHVIYVTVTVNSVEATVNRFAVDGEAAAKCPTVYE